ncbi:MAG TPA: RNA polymerase sigma factor [Acidobacteriota bacterium]|nr:RNA polymerase sigma factor [Acidobacteriota bacterium]
MDEKAIVRRCLEGDPASFRQIVDGHKAPLMAAATTVLGNRQDAEDICQETFLQAYRHLANFDSDRDLRAWLYTILYRRCLNVVKKKKRFAGVLDHLRSGLRIWAVSIDQGPRESRAVPSGLFEVLNPKERTVLSLWVNEGYTAVEIGRVLGCPSGTARYHLYNVRRKIRALTEKKDENVRDR